MKKLFVFLTCAMLTTGLYATIVGSGHDFSALGWNPGGEICQPCHTPHNAKVAPDDLVPLWNHDVTATVFTLYTSPTGTLDAGPLGQPAGVSKACLSCHDGTVALDAFGGAAGGTMIAGAFNLGTDLSNDHPISFTYDTALSTADGELYDPATQNSGLGDTIQNDLLFADQLECGSCHDVHNTVCPACASLLVIDNAASALCLTCHNK